MTRREKSAIIESLVEKFNAYDHFYIVDATSLSVEAANDFRRRCFQEGVIYQIAKNTLITKSLEKIKSEVNYSSFSETVLKGFSGILFVQEAGSTPAKIVKEFRKQKNLDKPILKGA
ncbi:MAG: 50S ribosomal protein L10, partial [Bacteroidota bacterium]